MDKEFLNDELMDDALLPDELFTSQVAQIRAKENTLLSDQALTQLMQCETYDECVQFLLDKGWGPVGGNSPEELLRTEKDKVWDLMHQLCSDKEMHMFDIFRFSKDYHNLKAAIKESYMQKEVPNIYMDGGTIPIETIRKAAADGDFSPLPVQMMKAAEEAREILFHTGDSQTCDVIIDRAALLANINIAIRACKANKSIDFLQHAFAECDSISVQKLMAVTRNGLDSIYEYLEQTSYADAIDAIKESPAAFDRWCDNRMMKLIKPQKYNAFTISPLAAYVLAKENEIKSVRIILSGKVNQLPDEKVKERLRDSYV